MSVRWITWAWDQDLQSGTKFVLVALADHAGEDGVCWPKTARLSEKTGLGNSTVRRHLDALEEGGYIERERRRRDDGTLGAYTYVLHQPALKSSAGDQRSESTPPPPDLSATTAQIGRAVEPSYEPSENHSPVVPSGDIEVAEVLFDFDAFWRAYPRGEGKPAANKAFARVTAKISFPDLMASLDAWCAYWDARGEPQYIPYAQKWLNQQYWATTPPPLPRRSGQDGAMDRLRAIAVAEGML